MNQESEEEKVMKGEADERIKVYEVLKCMKYRSMSHVSSWRE